ncbi:MAG TPA: GNVR domain-containing protein [Pyrinomonadaceae bacterium]|nr:GNVR domain-containing protein [Pyrinomonadaceae bacterium]
MSTEFRQRTPSEYLKIVLRRKWLIILPMIAVASAVALVVYRLPDVYQSVTLIVVKPSTLPTTVVPALPEDLLTRQLTSIAQVVTSRSSLEPLVLKYDLYKSERLRGEPMESIIDLLRKDIKVEPATNRNDISNGFNITVSGRDPKTTQAVTAELAGKYVSEQTKNQVASAISSKQFFDQQVKQSKDELDNIDKRRLEVMQQNVGSLPTQGAALVGQLAGLREEQKALIAEVGRLQDRRSALSGQVSLLKKTTEQTIADLSETTTDPRTTQAWAQLLLRKNTLEGELTRLKQEFKEKHPDVIAKQKEIDAVKQDMDQMISDWKDKIAEKQKKLEGRPDLTIGGTEAEIKLTEGEITRKQKMLDENEKQISDIMGRLNSVPGTEVALGTLDREYQTKKAAYDQLLQQQQKISINADAATQQQGEGIEVIDPANLPAKPVAPKRLLLSGVGLIFGLGLGFFLTALFEVPRLLTIQSSEDARHYTDLPVLISIPELLTPQEARSRPRRRKLLLAAGVTATVIAIPVLALALKATHLIELLTISSGRPS